MTTGLRKDLVIIGNRLKSVLQHLNDARSCFGNIDQSTEDYAVMLESGFDDVLISKLLDGTADIIGLISDRVDKAYAEQTMKRKTAD